MYLLPYEWCTNLERSFTYNKQEKGLLLTTFLRVGQIILLIVIGCNSSRISWSYFFLFVLKDVWWTVSTFASNFMKLQHVLIALSLYLYLSMCSTFHLKSFIIFFLHFLCFSYCFPFSRNVRTSKEYARVGLEPLCIKRLLGRSNSKSLTVVS